MFLHICHDRGQHVCCGLLGKLTGGYGDDRVKIAAWDTKHPNFPAFSLIISLRQSRKHLKMNLPKGFQAFRTAYRLDQLQVGSEARDIVTPSDSNEPYPFAEFNPSAPNGPYPFAESIV